MKEEYFSMALQNIPVRIFRLIERISGQIYHRNKATFLKTYFIVLTG